MTKTMIPMLILGAFTVIGASTMILPATAKDDAKEAAKDKECPGGPRDKWIGLDVAAVKAASLGYSVQRIEIDDGCYEIKGHDKNGADVKFNIDPVTSQIVPRSLLQR
ncbi:MAG: PepSY domain-containing protein [Rhodospirillaceae bacterium]|nr:PepSY domain-containing protein [Rhodospirillaceae bacterium]